jgi:serine-type D-Ala-D-Ala carboxypeptidase (penicillin-binding protein 5/6)
MRIAGRLAAGAVVALMVAGMIAAGGSPALATASQQAGSRPAGVRAPWAELANEVTGRDLWSRSSVTERPMGSITKVMTAYVVIEAGHLNRMITVPSGIIGYDAGGASTAGLRPGEKLTALQLLYAMLLPSGCDAAYTLATAYGARGSRAAFIGRMNAAARKFGLTRTHFSDFSGLPYPGAYTTYSTARDLVSLGRDVMRLPLFRRIVLTRAYRLAATNSHGAHVWKNLNPLLGRVSGATGIKTGFTPAAGNCLLFAATRGGKELIGVVLDSSSSVTGIGAAASDATAMLNWGFSR